MRLETKVSGEYFTSISVNINVDDLVILKIKEDECVIKLSIKNNVDDFITEHLIKSNRYDINTNIVDNILHIQYDKQEMLLVSSPDYYEIIGIIILVPEDKPYKIINNETK